MMFLSFQAYPGFPLPWKLFDIFVMFSSWMLISNLSLKSFHLNAIDFSINFQFISSAWMMKFISTRDHREFAFVGRFIIWLPAKVVSINRLKEPSSGRTMRIRWKRIMISSSAIHSIIATIGSHSTRKNMKYCWDFRLIFLMIENKINKRNHYYLVPELKWSLSLVSEDEIHFATRDSIQPFIYEKINNSCRTASRPVAKRQHQNSRQGVHGIVYVWSLVATHGLSLMPKIMFHMSCVDC